MIEGKRTFLGLRTGVLSLVIATAATCALAQSNDKPNILVIWGDDIGQHNISAYNHGVMGYQTPNIDRIAAEGALFTDAYAQRPAPRGELRSFWVNIRLEQAF